MFFYLLYILAFFLWVLFIKLVFFLITKYVFTKFNIYSTYTWLNNLNSRIYSKSDILLAIENEYIKSTLYIIL